MAQIKEAIAQKIDDVEPASDVTTMGPDPNTDEFGDLTFQDGNLYRYVKLNQDADVEDGDALVWSDHSADEVSGDTTGSGDGRAGEFAGVAVSDAEASSDSEDKAIWILVSGFHENLTDASNGVSEGDYILPDGSNAGEFAAMADGSEEEACGVANEGAADGTFAGRIHFR